MKTINILENTENLYFNDMLYEIMMTEKGPLFNPWSLGLLSGETKKEDTMIMGNYRIEDFILYLESFEAVGKKDNITLKTDDLHIPLAYSGSVLLVRELIEQYAEYKPSYGYKKLIELIFVDGRLTTAVDHSRAMYRIRRNLETGLRDMSNPKDVRCVFHFMDGLFVGKYKETIRARYLYALKMGLGKIWRRVIQK